MAAWLDGSTVTLATVAGLLAVLALTLRNVVLLLGRYRRLRTHERVPLGLDLATRGAREAMAPVVMTAVVTAIVMLPVILFGDISGQEIIEPMAWVIVGGLITSTLVSLFVLPALYLRFAPRQEPEPLDFGTEHEQVEPELVTASVGVS